MIKAGASSEAPTLYSRAAEKNGVVENVYNVNSIITYATYDPMYEFDEKSPKLKTTVFMRCTVWGTDLATVSGMWL